MAVSGENGTSFFYAPGSNITVPVSMQKCAGMSAFGFAVGFDPECFVLGGISLNGSVLSQDYACTVEPTAEGAIIRFHTSGNVFSTPCGKLFDLNLRVKANAKVGTYPLVLLPILDGEGNAELLDKQGREMSFSLTNQSEQYHIGSGWSGVYQSVDSAEWWQNDDHSDTGDQLADITLLSGAVTVMA